MEIPGRDGRGELGRLYCFFFPIAWEGQVSVPDALPSWVWDSRHAPAGHMPAQGCCKVSGNLGRAPSSPLPVAQMQGAFQCPPIAAHFHLPALWERTWCGGWEKKKKLGRKWSRTCVQNMITLVLVTGRKTGRWRLDYGGRGIATVAVGFVLHIFLKERPV